MNLNSVLLKKLNKVIFPSGRAKVVTKNDLVATFVCNLSKLGYTLSDKALSRLKFLYLKDLESFYKELVSNIKKNIGFKNYKPMYPNFPSQVMEMHESELYIRAIFYYLTGLREDFDVEERFPISEDEFKKLTVIDIATPDDVQKLYTQLLSANGSWSQEDKDIVTFLTSQKLRVEVICPNKENLAILNLGLMKLNTDFNITNCTDVVRLAAAISGGDVSLAENTKFKLKRSQRRILLSKLETVSKDNTVLEDMASRKQTWLRLGEVLHPGEYINQFPNSYSLFDQLRNHKVETFNSTVEQLIEQNKISQVSKVLSAKPGLLVRRLDQLLRNSNSKQSKSIIKDLEKVVDKVSTPVVLQALNHFQHRNEPSDYRVFFPKGNIGKLVQIKNELPELSAFNTLEIDSVLLSSLLERFRQKETLGKCYIDPILHDFPVPFAQRSASKALRTLTKGSKLPLSDSDYLRFFLWWKNGNDRVDIDLSAFYLNERFEHAGTVSYYNLRWGNSGNVNACHSGDIVDAPNGASEFIDVKLDIKHRYIAMCLNSFTRQPYKDLPECFAGYMARTSINSGEIYEPRTVENKVDLASDTTQIIPFIFDTVERKAIWCDIAVPSTRHRPNNVASNQSKLAITISSIVNLNKPTLYDLFSYHAMSRGQMVADRKNADIVFALDGDVTPFDINKILADFL